MSWLALVTQAEVPADDAWLSARERAVLGGLRVPGRRRDWRLGRWAAKRAVAAALGPSEVEVRAAEDGAPEALVAGRAAPVTISISHRAGLGACLAVPGRLAAGCDLELVEPHLPALAGDYFTPAELALVERFGPDGRDLAVALVWSGKESALKALRQGLRLDTRDVEVELSPGAGAGWRRLRVRYARRSLSGWWRRLEGDRLLTLVAEPASIPPRVIAPAIRR